MNQPIQAQRIPTPAWARRPQTEFDGDKTEAEQAALAFEPHLSAILSRLHTHIEAFFNDSGQVFDGIFPESSRLTGEYYWGGRCYTGFIKSVDERPHYRLSQNARCLEKKWIEHQTDFDYLELEAQVLLWRDTGEWELMPGFDTRVI